MCFFGTGSSVLVGEIESKPPQVSKVTIVASETLRAGIQYPYHASMRVNQRLTLTLKLTLTLSLRLKLTLTLSLETETDTNTVKSVSAHQYKYCHAPASYSSMHPCIVALIGQMVIYVDNRFTLDDVGLSGKIDSWCAWSSSGFRVGAV